MAEQRKSFPFSEFEPKWQGHWESKKTFSVPNPGEPGFDASKPKFYVLDMFPYPSGSGLHVGHPEGYTATDIITRYRRVKGDNVLHPMGWDAFGLPAEEHARKTGEHPRINTENNVNNFRGQLKRLGFAYDWDREVNTTDPDYVVRTGDKGYSLTGDMGNSYGGGTCPGKLRPKWNRDNNLRSLRRPGSSQLRS